MRLPRGVGTRKPEQVAEAVVRGIESGRAEIDVAPLSLRAGALASAVAPATAARLQRRLGSATRRSRCAREGSAAQALDAVPPDHPRRPGLRVVCDRGRGRRRGRRRRRRLDIDEYLRFARYSGVHIEHILETHNHADHVSGHGRLAAATGATIHIHRGADAPVRARAVRGRLGARARRRDACGRCTRPATGPSTPRSR